MRKLKPPVHEIKKKKKKSPRESPWFGLAVVNDLNDISGVFDLCSIKKPTKTTVVVRDAILIDNCFSCELKIENSRHQCKLKTSIP